MLQTDTKPWWETETFDRDTPLDQTLTMYSGPKGPALISVYSDGTTQKGWGLEGRNGNAGFMENYASGKFDMDAKINRFQVKGSPFAIVMRSIPVLCVDIDGKNGGLEHVMKLGLLPPTLAETSKSGNGYHLFYLQPDLQWDDETGYDGGLKDVLGLETGVDIRVTGCVFRYPSQRWNSRLLATLPDHLLDRLRQRATRIGASKDQIAKVMLSADDEEVLMQQEAMIQELKKPIQDGKRNSTLFALGKNLKDLEVGHWPALIQDRAVEVGLEDGEITKLIKNIQKY